MEIFLKDDYEAFGPGLEVWDSRLGSFDRVSTNNSYSCQKDMVLHRRKQRIYLWI